MYNAQLIVIPFVGISTNSHSLQEWEATPTAKRRGRRRSHRPGQSRQAAVGVELPSAYPMLRRRLPSA